MVPKGRRQLTSQSPSNRRISIAVVTAVQGSSVLTTDNYCYMSKIINFTTTHKHYTMPSACIMMLFVVLITL
jgi:hypothetical protein